MADKIADIDIESNVVNQYSAGLDDPVVVVSLLDPYLRSVNERGSLQLNPEAAIVLGTQLRDAGNRAIKHKR